MANQIVKLYGIGNGLCVARKEDIDNQKNLPIDMNPKYFLMIDEHEVGPQMNQRGIEALVQALKSALEGK